MASRTWGWARLVGGATILGVLVWRLGTGPFLDGVRSLSAASLLAAVAITLVTTACSAWRWSVVARGLGAEIPWTSAVVAYYRSQFLNGALPGGVLGDVDRGLRHGRETGNAGRGLRAVAWERTAGQAVQAVLTVVVLVAFTSPVRTAVGPISAVVLAVTLVLTIVLRMRGARVRGRTARVLRVARTDLRDGVLARRALLPVTLASVAVIAGHASVFLIAARITGTSASQARLLPLAALALLAMAVPLNLAGWGPREGVTAWAFAASGLGAAQGVSAAAAYGVMALVATLPGALVLVAGALPRARPLAVAAQPIAAQVGAGRG